VREAADTVSRVQRLLQGQIIHLVLLHHARPLSKRYRSQPGQAASLCRLSCECCHPAGACAPLDKPDGCEYTPIRYRPLSRARLEVSTFRAGSIIIWTTLRFAGGTG
jgi:hypothetical protein